MEIIRAMPAGPDVDIIVRVRVQPRASRAEVVGVHGDQLRIRLTASPVDQAANKMLVDLLAKAVGVRRSRVKLVSGQRNRNKEVRISGVSVAAAAEALGLS